MQYRYYKLRNLAWRVLVDCGIKSLPVDLNQITKHYFLTVRKFSDNLALINNLKENYGEFYGFRHGNTIYLSDEQSEQQRRFTLAHEIGHCLMHNDSFGNFAIEKESNSFAARILMPAAILHEMNIVEPEEIAKVCDVSLISATYRAERITNILNKRNLYCTDELEKRLLANFKEFIKRFNLK